MAEEQDRTEQDEQPNGGSGHGRGGMSTAAKAAAAAAATGAATVAVRKVLSRDHSESNGSSNGSSEQGQQTKSPRAGGSSLFASVASGGWDAARDALMPIAEDAAEAAGKYLATSGPEFVRDRIVPRFIESFNDAKDGG